MSRKNKIYWKSTIATKVDMVTEEFVPFWKNTYTTTTMKEFQ